VVGRPFVPGCSVTVVVEEHLRDATAITFTKRRRKNSRRLTGHRQQLTALRVVDIQDAPLRLAGGAGGGAAPTAAVGQA
jgi:large subunit ribosomal protein L21